MLTALSSALVLALAGQVGTWAVVDQGGPPPSVYVVPAPAQAGVYHWPALHGAAPVCVALAQAPDVVVVPRHGSPDPFPREMPKQWLGVRLSPVPAALAAHIGAEGLMILNIALDSPADRAGLGQYDVIRTFGGEPVNEMDDLLELLGETTAGAAVEVEIVRGGQAVQRQITPVERPRDENVEYKYAEPQAAIEDQLRVFGHRLQRDPQGGWIFDNLGPLHGVPDVLKQLEEHFKDLQGLNIHLDPDLGGSDDIRSGARVEVRVQVEDDGRMTTVQRDADGTIRVQRTDPDGNETEAVYENEDEFQAEDPETFELYRGSGVGHGQRWMTVRPFGPHLQDLRQRFQIDVHDKLYQALRQADEATRRARDAAADAQREAERVFRRHIEIERRRSSDADQVDPDQPEPPVQIEESRSLKVSVENGRITVIETRNGEKTTHEFENKDEFKAQAPDLYERVKNLFE